MYANSLFGSPHMSHKLFAHGRSSAYPLHLSNPTFMYINMIYYKNRTRMQINVTKHRLYLISISNPPMMPLVSSVFLQMSLNLSSEEQLPKSAV